MKPTQLRITLRILGPFLGLLIVYLGFSFYNPAILSLLALEKIGQQTVVIGIATLGMTLVIVSGGIDLSAGSLMALCTVVLAKLMVELSVNPLLAAILVLLFGLALGFLNGWVITKLKVVPFIVTLGGLLIYRGLAKALSDSSQVKVSPSFLSELLATLTSEKRWQLLPPGAWVMIALAILLWLLLRYTAWGRYVYAVGSQEEAARLCGVPIQTIKRSVYCLAGGFFALSGLMLLSYQEQGDPTGAEAYELDVIAAVVLGGGSLSGGEGSVLGSLIGAALMTVIRFGCQVSGFPPWVTQISTGLIIVGAVALDQWRRRL